MTNKLNDYLLGTPEVALRLHLILSLATAAAREAAEALVAAPADQADEGAQRQCDGEEREDESRDHAREVLLTAGRHIRGEYAQIDS
jgi:hypothetical protein